MDTVLARTRFGTTLATAALMASCATAPGERLAPEALALHVGSRVDGP
jgi:hypothetical protein